MRTLRIIKLDRWIKHKQIREWTEALIFALLVAVIFRTWLYAPYRVPTGSMIHTIEPGDQLFVNSHAYGFKIPFADHKLFTKPVQRGDIIVFPYPEDPSIDFVKRVVGVGGDTIRIDGEDVYVNDKLLDAPFIFYDDTIPPFTQDRTIRIPEHKLWVMGDNRRNSKDSRFWGFVDEDTVKAKAGLIFWSHDVNENLFTGYRFNRIGTILK